MTTTTLIRASSLPELFDCPARWEAKHLRGLRTPANSKSVLGKAIHASTGAYDSARVLGSPISIEDAAAAAVDAIHKPDEDVDWDDDKPATAEGIALALHRKYCKDIAPTQDYVAVEARCEALEITDLGITLTGTVDRAYRDKDGCIGIADLKSGKAAVGSDDKVKTQGHGLQLGTYELLAEVAIGQAIEAPARIIGLQTGITPKAQRIAIGTLINPREALLGTADAPGALQHAARFLESGAFFGNPRSQLCHERYCPIHKNCRYRG